ncbi:MAG: hypothetical protein WCL28_14240 [bacterium]
MNLRHWLGRLTLRILLLLMSFTFASAPVIAADIQKSERFLHLNGQIVRGDYDKIRKLLLSENGYFLGYNWQLNSVGGDVYEALAIGRMFKELFITVNVADADNPRAKCASACFLIFVSAVARNAVSHSVGVHRPFFEPTYFAGMNAQNAQRRYAAMTEEVRAYLKENDVPEALITRMFSTPSTEILWLSDNEMEQLGGKSAWYDQYIISICGFSDRMFHQAVQRGRIEQAKKWAMCEADIALEAAERNLEKFKQAVPR